MRAAVFRGTPACSNSSMPPAARARRRVVGHAVQACDGARLQAEQLAQRTGDANRVGVAIHMQLTTREVGRKRRIRERYHRMHLRHGDLRTANRRERFGAQRARAMHHGHAPTPSWNQALGEPFGDARNIAVAHRHNH